MKTIWINFRTHNSSHTYSIKNHEDRTRTVSRRLAEIHRRQADHAKTRTAQQPDVPPGGREWTARRFLEKSRKLQSNSAETDGKGCSFNQTEHNAIYIYLKHQWQLPLPGIFFKSRINVSTLQSKSSCPCSHSHVSSSPYFPSVFNPKPTKPSVQSPPRTTAPLFSLIPSLSWLMGNLFTHSLSKTKIT